ncbi:alpha- and gamma-adaptin-binding protein p34 [Paralichthys olivaceus]|uniref:alpha- and gamma-adaptin-binding protein p34 n=1 Tax=Paralichthys olivaceus TaxID=8255 RepID=UPI00097D7EDE|nr:PREDICTED: alpha- and gamma-adaptin-binding protein p34 isoform X1 [Paralichthys olivaceus]
MSDTEETTEMTIPCVLITSCGSESKEEELIKQILSTKTLPEPIKREEAVTWYPWEINNKYYTADVRLCVVPSTFQMSSEIAQSTQAFIAYFDSTAKDGLEKLHPWISVVEDLAPEVLILVCDRVCETGVTRHEAQQWCLAHAFELVELNPQELPDEDDDFPESTGVKRIVQALNANVWSSMEMKDEHNQGFGLMSSLVASRHNNPRNCQDTASSSLPEEGTLVTEAHHTEERSTDTQEQSVVDAMTDLDIQELANLTSGDADVDNFERLFTKLKEMKDKASSLPHEQRKVHAEKVAKAFWTAIGGDVDEIDGLSSGEES